MVCGFEVLKMNTIVGFLILGTIISGLFLFRSVLKERKKRIHK